MTAVEERAPGTRPRFAFTVASILPFALDLVCVVIFVALGKENHVVHNGVGWFFNVWCPLSVGLTVGALVTRLYVRADQWPLRLLATVAIAVVIGGPLRTLTGRNAYTVLRLSRSQC